MNIVNWIITRIRNFGNRFSGIFSNKYPIIYTGTVVKMTYTNYKHDPNPLILVLYSGVRYVHALNLNYLTPQDKAYLLRLIYQIKNGAQTINPRIIYQILKRDVYYTIVRKSYRKYFSNMIINPYTVSNGWTSFNLRLANFNDPFITELNRVLNARPQIQNIRQNRISYYPQELQERIIQSINSTPVGRGTIPATTPTRKDIT